MLPPDVTKLQCTKIDFGWGCVPDSIAGFKGPTFKGRGRERRKEEGSGSEGRRGEGRGGEGRGGEGRVGERSERNGGKVPRLALLRPCEHYRLFSVVY